MKAKSKLFTAVLLCCVLALVFTACAGCTETTDSDSNPVAVQPSESTLNQSGNASAVKKITFADIAGTWYSTTSSDNGEELVLVKFEINADGTGGGTLYKAGKVTPFYYYTFHLVAVTPDETSQSENKGVFTMVYDPPKESSRGSITGNSEELIASPDNIVLSKTPSKDYWGTYKQPVYPTPKITKEHNTADYIEDGDYYLEDDNGRSFTETLWTGDVAPYVADYKNIAKMSNAGSQAGNWVKYVRGLSDYHHVFEPTEPVSYQTVDETMDRGYGTCDDLAILAARGLKELGYNVSILVFPKHMDIGIGEEDYLYFNNYITGNKYAAYQSATPVIYDGYYYIDIADWEKTTDLGAVCTEEKFKYNMTLKKLIPL